MVHASCVAIGEAGVLIRGPSGAGKSDLALRLMDGGAKLVADDYCETVARDGHVTASAPATIAGQIEVRGFGIVATPTLPTVTVALIVDLVPSGEIERMPETPFVTIDGVRVPRIGLDPHEASAAAKIRFVLQAMRS